MKRTIMIIITLLTLTLPVATLADSPRKDDDYKRRNSRNDDDHDRFHRALESEHRNYHQYNRIDDRGDWIRHRRFHQYLEAKHRRAHRNFCDDCWRLVSRISHNRHDDEDFDWNDQRRHSRHNHR